ncbi:pentapeptide repeat-containing protein [Streptomyces sp. NPDC017993]|uniref:pentapeptide repeat-containing protein n=1 Tax=Streptomyces sp. NPDC017993 TaxID=3365027 RepID=UPI00379B7EFD
MATLSSGADIDHRGTPFTEDLLTELLRAVTDPSTNRPCLGDAWFVGARFEGPAMFADVTFGGHARFDEATFEDEVYFTEAKFSCEARFAETTFETAWFIGATFFKVAVFTGATFGGNAWLSGVKFGHEAVFVGTQFESFANFEGAKFDGEARFNSARFGDSAVFGGALFRSDAKFPRVAFERAVAVGPLGCVGTFDLSEAEFGTAVVIEAAAAAVRCRRTRWSSTAALRLRHASVDFSDAVMEYPVSLSAHPRPFRLRDQEVAEPEVSESRVRAVSLRGVDAAHMVLTDVDLTVCQFTGTIHLDQLRLEGRCRLATAPSGLRWHGIRPVRWSPRRTLAEEQHWRAAQGSNAEGWTSVAEGGEVLGPAALAPVYRQLRKAFEDSRDEPGAADFYYGEMEMRRHDADTPRAERLLLAAYWGVSGYGMRASRALGLLLVAMTATVLAMMLWGLPQDASKPTSTGTFTGRNITMTTDTPDPVNPSGPLRGRLTTERFEKSLRVVINSVVFRSSEQELTTAGTYTEMASRVTEPLLLGLAILAIRGRVKR